MQLRKQGPHGKDLGKDMTDGKFDVVGTRKGVRLTKKFIGSIIKIHRGKNWAFDLKHDFLTSDQPSREPRRTVRGTKIYRGPHFLEEKYSRSRSSALSMFSIEFA